MQEEFEGCILQKDPVGLAGLNVLRCGQHISSGKWIIAEEFQFRQGAAVFGSPGMISTRDQGNTQQIPAVAEDAGGMFLAAIGIQRADARAGECSGSQHEFSDRWCQDHAGA